MPLIHATCIAVDGIGVLIRGPSGSGKSDLALRLIDAGAELVSDDYCELSVVEKSLRATAPDAIAGKIEVRGRGIITMPHRPSVNVELLVDLMPKKEIERYPEERASTIEGVTVRHLAIDPDTVSAAAKVRLALTYQADEASDGKDDR